MAEAAATDRLVMVRTAADIVQARQAARALAVELGFSLVRQTKLVTAVSELARNMLEFGGGGTARQELLDNGVRPGIRITFEDQGPGIADISQAMTDGYTSFNGLGLGLGGSKRLVDEFQILSQVGQGTCVTIIMWR